MLSFERLPVACNSIDAQTNHPERQRGRNMSAFSDTATLNRAEAEWDALAAKYFGSETVAVNVRFGALTHPGKVRTNNEDHYSVVRRFRGREVLLTNLPKESYPPHNDEAFALAVADGVGGAAFGELASMIALRSGWELTGSAFKWGFKVNESESLELQESLRVFIRMIHRRVQAEAGPDSPLRGMGTTLTGALTIGMDAFIAHVGDSRAYIFRRGKLHRLTRDHTLAEQLVSDGILHSIDEASSGFRSTLINCLGGSFEDVTVDTCHVPLQDGDQLLLCTDGLTDMVSEADISGILTATTAVQDSCQALIETALINGGRDNVTVVLAQYQSANNARCGS